MKMDVCPGDDLQRSFLSKADGWNMLDDPNSFRRTFHKRNSRSLVHFKKCSAFGEGLTRSILSAPDGQDG